MGPGMLGTEREWIAFLLILILMGAGCGAACTKACSMVRINVDVERAR